MASANEDDGLVEDVEEDFGQTVVLTKRIQGVRVLSRRIVSSMPQTYHATCSPR